MTCSGLLTSEDIAETLERERANGDIFLLPPSVLNHEGKFLDDPTIEDLQVSVKQPVIVPDGTFIQALRDSVTPEG